MLGSLRRFQDLACYLGNLSSKNTGPKLCTRALRQADVLRGGQRDGSSGFGIGLSAQGAQDVEYELAQCLLASLMNNPARNLNIICKLFRPLHREDHLPILRRFQLNL